MTQHDDDRLATWLAAEPVLGTTSSLERALRAARATRQRPAWLVAATGGTIAAERTNRSAGLAWAVVAAVALIGLVIGGLVVGGWLRPQPVPDAVLPSTTALPSPNAEAPFGGGPILAYLPHQSPSPCDLSTLAPFDLISLDAGTGAQTLLGTTAEDCSARGLNLQWAPDAGHILMTDEWGQETLTLDTPTPAAGDLTFVCCDLPTDVQEGGGSAFHGWMLSPAGDRVSAIHTAVIQVPGTEGVPVSDGIVVADADGSGLSTLTAPSGAAIRGWATWSPDQSALVVAACNPCNHAAEANQPATAENHEHLYVVPVDGSPVRELLDDTGGWLWTPMWSPDGSTFATVRRECASPEPPPQCTGEITSSLLLVAAEDGADRVLVTSEQLGDDWAEIGLPRWSDDAGRIAFDVLSANLETSHVFVVDADGTNLVDIGEGSLVDWSPDGEWLLVTRPTDEEGFIDLWIMRADGSDARSLGNLPRVILRGSGVVSEPGPRWSTHLPIPVALLAVLLAGCTTGGTTTPAPSGRSSDPSSSAAGGSVASPVAAESAAAADVPAGRILFHRVAADGALEYFTINADGTDEQALPGIGDCAPCVRWSPDGARIWTMGATAARHVLVLHPDAGWQRSRGDQPTDRDAQPRSRDTQRGWPLDRIRRLG